MCGPARRARAPRAMTCAENLARRRLLLLASGPCASPEPSGRPCSRPLSSRSAASRWARAAAKARAGARPTAAQAKAPPRSSAAGAASSRARASSCAWRRPSVRTSSSIRKRCRLRLPHRGSVVDLVCACSGAICPVGIFSTCAEAAELLANQTEQGVCVQVAEGRCAEINGPPATTSSSGGNPACDRQCVKDCGGGRPARPCATATDRRLPRIERRQCRADIPPRDRRPPTPEARSRGKTCCASEH